MRSASRHRTLLAVGSTLLTVASGSQAQIPAIVESPGETRPELPAYEGDEPERVPVLPRIRLPSEPSTEGLSAGVRVAIRQIDVTGYTVFSDEEMAELVAPYVGRSLSFVDLTALRNELTLAYVNEGYVSSGAVIPDQNLSGGVLLVQVVEGTLEGIDIETDGRYNEKVLRKRLERGVGGVVNVYALEESLQVLQLDPRILRLEAELDAGESRDASRLRVVVRERQPWWVLAEASNYQSPSIGAARGEFRGGYRNITGLGDDASLGYRVTGGLHDFDFYYAVPLNRYETTFGVLAKAAFSRVTEDPFAQLDIDSNTQTAGLELRQPVYRSLNTQADLFLLGQYRHSSTSLLGRGFAFVPGPSEDGESAVSVLRIGGSWQYSDRRQVLAMRSTFNVGLDILGATNNADDSIPDGQFFYWLGQAQWARRFGFLDSQVLARLDTQISNRPLLGLEQFAIGGHSTVRGYRENTLVRDNGVIGSAEVRVPVWRRRSGVPILELVPFVDAGYSWQRDRETLGPTTLVSAGVGLRWSITDWARFRIDWGARLKDIEDVGEWNLQQEGIHMALTVFHP